MKNMMIAALMLLALMVGNYQANAQTPCGLPVPYNSEIGSIAEPNYHTSTISYKKFTVPANSPINTVHEIAVVYLGNHKRFAEIMQLNAHLWDVSRVSFRLSPSGKEYWYYAKIYPGEVLRLPIDANGPDLSGEIFYETVSREEYGGLNFEPVPSLDKKGLREERWRQVGLPPVALPTDVDRISDEYDAPSPGGWATPSTDTYPQPMPQLPVEEPTAFDTAWEIFKVGLILLLFVVLAVVLFRGLQWLWGWGAHRYGTKNTNDEASANHPNQPGGGNAPAGGGSHHETTSHRPAPPRSTEEVLKIIAAIKENGGNYAEGGENGINIRIDAPTSAPSQADAGPAKSAADTTASASPKTENGPQSEGGVATTK